MAFEQVRRDARVDERAEHGVRRTRRRALHERAHRLKATHLAQEDPVSDGVHAKVTLSRALEPRALGHWEAAQVDRTYVAPEDQEQ